MATETLPLTVGEMITLGGALLTAGGIIARVEFLRKNSEKLEERLDQFEERHKSELDDVAARSEKETRERADEAKKIGLEAFQQSNIVQAGLSMFREHVATNYVNRDAMRETEQRILANVKSMSDNISASVDKLSNRLDRLLENREGRGRTD